MPNTQKIIIYTAIAAAALYFVMKKMPDTANKPLQVEQSAPRHIATRDELLIIATAAVAPEVAAGRAPTVDEIWRITHAGLHR